MKSLLLVILDGFGISFEKKGNAVALAKIPNLKYISENYPGTTLRASGMEVGLSWGEMGSSEVGHTNIGGGLVIYQNLPKINLTIKDKSFFAFPVWKKAIEHAIKNNSTLHLMGLVSNGGVHSHIEHLFAILEAIRQLNFKGRVFIHIFTDGQDAAPQSALKFVNLLEGELKRLKLGEIASVCGRYYAMDKNENWDKIQKAYECLTEGKGIKAFNIEKAIADSYEKNIKDEHIEPTVMADKNENPVGLVKDNDVLIFFNFRADRARQITKAFTDDEFNKFPRSKLKNILFISMTQYGIGYPMESVFPPEHLSASLGKIISDAGKTQFRIAETEKYAHVTYFFNGGIEQEFSGEDRAIIPSKDVLSYEAAPEMSAYEITERLVSEIKKQKYDFLVANFANGDIVGHTGDLKAAIKAIEVLDECVGILMKEVLKLNGTLAITADHGNVEEMINLETGEIDKEHSINPVPFWIVGPDNKKFIERKTGQIAPQGILADVAPTILEIMAIPKPKEMTGTSLLNIISNCPLP